VEIHFILFRPAVPGNVGASARALNTMGFRHLRLIDPCDHLNEEALMLAHGSHDLLRGAGLFDTFEEAVDDMDLVVATTAKERTAKHDYHSVRELAQILQEKQSRLDKVGILFGTEESGLPNELILQSDLAMTIPMATSYPSLNLAQSVMVTAYELSVLNQLSRPGQSIQKSGEGFGTLKKQVHHLLRNAGIPEGSPLYHRIMERIALTGPVDIPLFLSVLNRLNQKEE
jgi:tRNA/rRNA methyltransferase